MAMSLFWRGRVVRNFSALMVVLVAISQADAQSLQTKKITYTCSSTDFETVIEDLSRATGVHFVYSSNKIQASRLVNLIVANKPLHEVLDLLSSQLNVSFKIQEHYITIKPRGVQFQAGPNELVSLKKAGPLRQVKPHDQGTETERPLGRFVVEKMRKATTLSDDEDVTPYIVKLKPYFNPTFLEKVPIQYLKSTAKKLSADHGWFVSVGAVVNDYSAGSEIQAGLPRAYVVFSPTWLRDNQYHGALGMGTSLRLSNLLSLRPVYSYAAMKETRMDHVNTTFVKSPSYQINTITDHHQVKLMLQYDVSKKLRFRVGPTFNQSHATSSYQAIEQMSYRAGAPQYYPPDGDGAGPGPRSVFHTNVIQPLASVTSSKFWVGWEASFSYRINFFK